MGDDVEVVVARRKGVDEKKALKLLSKFLQREQEKEADEQVGGRVGSCVVWTCMCVWFGLVGGWVGGSLALLIQLPWPPCPSFSKPTQLPPDVSHQLQQVRDSLEGKEVGPLALTTALASPGAGAAATAASPGLGSSPPPLKEEDEFEGGLSGKMEEEGAPPLPPPEPSSSEKKHKKKKKHKKE